MLKSSRHSKITGDFGEALVLYWLSKHGFECARVDHTGIDLIANNPHTGEVMGISVKSRSRNVGKENTHLGIKKDEFEKVQLACAAFRCVPYFAIVIDAGDVIRCFLLTMEHLLSIAPVKVSGSSWKMREKWLTQYYDNRAIRIFEMQTSSVRGW